MALSASVRMYLQGDIIVYSNSFSYTSTSFYYVREPVVWLGGRFLYEIIGNSNAVFFVFDFLSGLILWSALLKFGVPRYVFFGILLFFPFVLGMQNIYRQHLSVIFLIFAVFAAKEKEFWKSLLSFGFACLTHNAAAVFLPVLVVRRFGFKNFKYFLSIVIAFLGIIFGAESKSMSAIGADLGQAYFGVILLFLFIYVLLDFGRVRYFQREKYFIIITFLIIVFISQFYLGGSGKERLAMMVLMVLYPYIAILIEAKFSNPVILRMLYVNFGFIPLFLFDTSKFILSF